MQKGEATNLTDPENIEQIKIALKNMAPNIVQSIVVVVIALILFVVVGKVISRMKKRDKILESESGNRLLLGIAKIARVVIIIVALFLVLEINGVSLSALIASMGLVGAAATLAAQDIMKDAISGMYISGERMFAVGDTVQHNGRDGEVLDFNLRSTKIRLVGTNHTMFISNRNISEIIVLTHNNFMDLPMPYEVEVERAEEIIANVINTVKKDERFENIEYVGVGELASSSIRYRVLYECIPAIRGVLAMEVRREFLMEMARNGLSVPYEKLEVINIGK